jgi:hypothetical protein
LKLPPTGLGSFVLSGIRRVVAGREPHPSTVMGASTETGPMRASTRWGGGASPESTSFPAAGREAGPAGTNPSHPAAAARGDLMQDWRSEYLRPRTANQGARPRATPAGGATATTVALSARATACCSPLSFRVRLSREPGVVRRELRRAHAVEMAHEGVPLIVIQRQLGHSNLGITSIYLQRIDNAENHRHRPRPARPHGCGQRVAPALIVLLTRSAARRARR